MDKFTTRCPREMFDIEIAFHAIDGQGSILRQIQAQIADGFYLNPFGGFCYLILALDLYA